MLPPLFQCSSSSMFQMHGRQLMRHGLGSEHERVATVRSWGAEPAPWIAASERAREARAAAAAATKLRHAVIHRKSTS